MPGIPNSYKSIPDYGRIRCNLDSLSIDDPQFPDQHSTTPVVLWEKPNPTIEKGSFGDGYPTIIKPVNWIKRVGFCDIVRVTNYAWSGWDNTIYFYVESDEYGYDGWIKQEYVEFPYVGPMPTQFPTDTPLP
jgi:hypothetical protein